MAKEKGFSDKVGIHLNITEGMATTEEIKKDRLFCDENGLFNKNFYGSIRCRLFFNKKRRRIIYSELKEQLK